MFGLDDAINAGLQIVNKVIPDPQKQAEIALEVARLKQAGEFKGLEAMLQVDLAQIEVNKVEAAHGGVFKGGWRPAVGWICAFALAWSFVLMPFLVLTVQLIAFYGGAGVNSIFPLEHLPKLDSDVLLNLLMGMLGLGGLRTYEKQQTAVRVSGAPTKKGVFKAIKETFMGEDH